MNDSNIRTQLQTNLTDRSAVQPILASCRVAVLVLRIHPSSAHLNSFPQLPPGLHPSPFSTNPFSISQLHIPTSNPRIPAQTALVPIPSPPKITARLAQSMPHVSMSMSMSLDPLPLISYFSSFQCFTRHRKVSSRSHWTSRFQHLDADRKVLA